VRDMGCYLEDYRAPVGTWVARFSWRSAVGLFGMRGGKICMGPMILCAEVIATLLIIRGVELNAGIVESIVQVLCSFDGNKEKISFLEHSKANLLLL